ncbi:Uncharacterized protein BP5553_05958 [Venustampulla echinocandica]|uniref:Transcription factor domain-containing protein n=1 Tax=Venustampulla echinocandica TaxID=2656787 RepID=A0A370TM62_9HELO|nr:Uncharacterized protein BP5553_05958 [Venustampulla echinocandica]RDL36606.1 Uncharacterized protein BP5553_05958 [Venustampulla echinocandica]
MAKLLTMKDKTLVEILDRLKSLESKVDRIPLRPSGLSGFGRSLSTPSTSTDVDSTPYASSLLRPPFQSNPGGSSRSQPYRHTSAAHKMLTWPAVQQLLLQVMPSNLADLKSLEQEGSAFIIRMQKGTSDLPLDEALQDRPFVGMQTQATRAAGGARVTFPNLTREMMHHLATAYFDTFNLLYPFMDRQNFISDTLSRVQTEGFNGDTDSVIALLVFALGELAIEGSRGAPIEGHNGRSSGVRGGSALRPPGLAYFNEARKRIGFVLTECDLENVQIFSLAACVDNPRPQTHETKVTHDISTDSITNVVPTMCNTIDWDSPRGHLTKRAYWHCVLMETGLHLELDLPLTGIIALEESIGLPTFNGPFCEADDRGNQSSHFHAHYASQIALRQLCAELHDNINDSMTNTQTDPASSEPFRELTAGSLKQLASQLTQWHGMLPRELQWKEDDPASFPSPQPFNFPGSNQAVDPELAPQPHPPRRPLFSTDVDSEPVQYPYLYDIQVAFLRTKYYYAKYMIYRPFVYKALHFPDLMTQDDAEGVAECLRVFAHPWP